MGIRERTALIATAVLLAALVMLRVGTITPRQARPDLRIAAGISLPVDPLAEQAVLAW